MASRTIFYAAVLLPAVLLTACGDGEPVAPETKTTPPKAAPATSAAPSPSPSSPSPAQSPASIDSAADGRDLDACRDGTCEVVVKAGDELRFAKKFDTDSLMVLSAGDTFAVTNPRTGFTSSIGGGGMIQTGGVRIDIGESEGTRTALRISPRG
jgi:hypothetical protein